MNIFFFQEPKSAHHFHPVRSTISSDFNGNAFNDAFVREERNSEITSYNTY